MKMKGFREGGGREVPDHERFSLAARGKLLVAKSRTSSDRIHVRFGGMQVPLLLGTSSVREGSVSTVKGADVIALLAGSGRSAKREGANEERKGEQEVGNVVRGIARPTDGELLAYGFVQGETEEGARQRTSSVFARAMVRPDSVAADEVSRTLGDEMSEGVGDVLHNLRHQREGEQRGSTELRIDQGALTRVRREVKYFDRKAGESTTMTVTEPGAVEKVGLALVSLCDDPELRGIADSTILSPLARLIRDYRSKGDTPLQTAPEMPELTEALVAQLDRFGIQHTDWLGNNQQARYRIYEVLGQLALPIERQEEIVAIMDVNKDLEHPLAFQLTLDLAEQRPESSWIQTQQERREILLGMLYIGSKQDLFDNFDQILERSRGLVYHGDPLRPRDGKVGMEFELLTNYDSLPEPDDTPRSEIPRMVPRYGDQKGLDNEQWELGLDGWNKWNEIRRRSTTNALEHDSAYVHSLVDLSRWMSDYARKIICIDVHLDGWRHRIKPKLGDLFSYYDPGRQDSRIGSVVASDRVDTWEIRGIFLPKANGTIHPARIEDVIGMYISAAQRESDYYLLQDKLALESGKTYDIKQLIWGHLLTYLPEEEGRLAALMLLHDQDALANVNPLAFVNSYDRASLQMIYEQQKDKLLAPSSQQMLRALRAYLDGEDIGNIFSIDIRNYYVAEEILGPNRFRG
ncbi:MAG TPA: hypothetical protein VND99_06235 [Candidatus Acidoferrales bacterium]|nr:hypothetical protein [Candidatus Acidoferrales bacterium]